MAGVEGNRRDSVRESSSGAKVMNANRWFLLTCFLLMAGLIGGPSRGQGRPESAAPQHEAEVEPDASSTGDDQPAVGVDTATRRLMAQLKRLQKEIPERLDLSPDQERAIDRLFDAYFSELRARRPGRGNTDGDAKDELAELREELQRAREERDAEGIRQIRERMRELLQEQRNRSATVAREFLDDVASELDEDQVEEFHRLIEEMGLSSAAGGETIQQLMRALMHPDVALTPAQQEKVRERMREALTSMSEDEQMAADMSAAAARMKGDIMKELTPVQRKKVEAILKDSAKTGAPAKRNPRQLPAEPEAVHDADEPPDE
jgi:hypothetical protein